MGGLCSFFSFFFFIIKTCLTKYKSNVFDSPVFSSLSVGIFFFFFCLILFCFYAIFLSIFIFIYIGERERCTWKWQTWRNLFWKGSNQTTCWTVENQTNFTRTRYTGRTSYTWRWNTSTRYIIIILSFIDAYRKRNKW
jgi:predicted membrane protein